MSLWQHCFSFITSNIICKIDLSVNIFRLKIKINLKVKCTHPVPRECPQKYTGTSLDLLLTQLKAASASSTRPASEGDPSESA